MNKKIFILFMILLLAIKNYSIGETSKEIPNNENEYSHVFFMKGCQEKYKRLNKKNSYLLTNFKKNIKLVDWKELNEGFLVFVQSSQQKLDLNNIEWIKTKQEYEKDIISK